MYASTIHSFVAPGSQALRSAVNLVAARARQLHKRSSAVAVKVGLLSVSNKAVPCAPAAGLTKPQVAGPATWGVLFGTSGLHEAGFAVPLVAALTGLARGEAKPNPLIPADAPYSNPKAVDAQAASSRRWVRVSVSLPRKSSQARQAPWCHMRLPGMLRRPYLRASTCWT